MDNFWIWLLVGVVVLVVTLGVFGAYAATFGGRDVDGTAEGAFDGSPAATAAERDFGAGLAQISAIAEGRGYQYVSTHQERGGLVHTFRRVEPSGE